MQSAELAGAQLLISFFVALLSKVAADKSAAFDILFFVAPLSKVAAGISAAFASCICCEKKSQKKTFNMRSTLKDSNFKRSCSKTIQKKRIATAPI